MTLRRGVVVAVLASLVSRVAIAAPGTSESSHDPASAQALFERGREAFARGEVDAACDLLSESLRLDPAVGTLFNLAACEERQGKVASAWLHLREGLDQLGPGDARMRPAAERMKALEPRVPLLEVKLAPGAPANTLVSRDGVELGSVSLGLALPVNPGAHRIVAQAPGHDPREVAISVAEGEKKVVVLAPGAAAKRERLPGEERGSGLRTFGYVTAGTGAAAIVVGSVAGLVALGRSGTAKAHCNDAGVCDSAEGLSALDDAQSAGTVSTVTLVAGAALVATGIVLVIVGKPSPGKRAAALTWRF